MPRKLLLISLVLCACGPVTAFDQPGVPVSRLAADVQTCAARSNAEAPPDVQVITTYERRFRRDRFGGPPRWRYERERDIVDVNEGPRAFALQQCMVSRGYRIAQLPRCSVTPSVTASTPLPTVTEQSCVVNITGVGPVIVTP
ncbi:MAG: hypothetical protein AAGA38_16085 [Pseudomonadota bacterium]